MCFVSLDISKEMAKNEQDVRAAQSYDLSIEQVK